MAKEPKPATDAAPAPAYIVAIGQLERAEFDAKTNKVKKLAPVTVGQGYDPVDDEERDSLLASGRIVPASEYFAKQGGAPVAAVIDAATKRAEAAEAEAARLRDELAAAKAAVPAPNPPA